MIYKTVAHMKDCKNRTFRYENFIRNIFVYLNYVKSILPKMIIIYLCRYIDDWRGLQCDADVCTDLRQKVIKTCPKKS